MMITIIIPEWLVWMIVAMTITTAVLTFIRAKLEMDIRKLDRSIRDKLFELMELENPND